MAFFPQFDDLENDFQQEVGEIIDDILGENLTDAQKEELCNSFSFIFNRYTNEQKVTNEFWILGCYFLHSRQKLIS